MSESGSVDACALVRVTDARLVAVRTQIDVEGRDAAKMDEVRVRSLESLSRARGGYFLFFAERRIVTEMRTSLSPIDRR